MRLNQPRGTLREAPGLRAAEALANIGALPDKASRVARAVAASVFESGPARIPTRAECLWFMSPSYRSRGVIPVGVSALSLAVYACSPGHTCADLGACVDSVDAGKGGAAFLIEASTAGDDNQRSTGAGGSGSARDGATMMDGADAPPADGPMGLDGSAGPSGSSGYGSADAADTTPAEAGPPVQAGKSCPEISPAPSRTVSVSMAGATTTATYGCLSGFRLTGEATRTCKSDGTWSGPPPDCLPVDCHELSPPDHGGVIANTTTAGSHAEYSCSDGYNLVGSSTRSCQTDGTWSGVAPTCLVKDCGSLPDPVQGKVRLISTTFGSTATYECASGYSLSGSSSRTCQPNGSWSGAAPSCVRPSCSGGAEGAGGNCGVDGHDDCCSTLPVPSGTFQRDNDPHYTATISSFLLDKYEITVGRFRAFVKAGMGTAANPPAPGSGAHPRIAKTGWDANWNVNLATAGQLEAAVQCNSDFQTWTGGDDRRPMNCITWYEAFAFCIWDGGRLPTELEWSYAAIGGNEQRKYPWGADEPGPDVKLAIHNCYNGGSTTGCNGVLAIAPVGSAPAGKGRWDQLDLAGNIAEYTLDLYADYPVVCTDCANISTGTTRTRRGGSYYRDNRTWIEPVTRASLNPAQRFIDGGARCARNS